MENNYSYDLFISYRRHPSWSNWVREHVCRLLDDYLTRDLGRQPHVFVDQQIEPGARSHARQGTGDTLSIDFSGVGT